MATVETPLSFNMSHNSKNTEMCKLGSSSGVPPNWDYCTKEIRAGLSSKLWAFTLDRAILQVIPWTPTVTKSQSILLQSSPSLAIVEEAS